MGKDGSLEEMLEGVLFFHSETGTEGGYWAFQDSQFISSDNASWSYEGLHILRNGDRLTIYHPENNNEVWSGVIALKQYPLFTEDARGLWIHADQTGIDRETWAEYFFKSYRARLIPSTGSK
ncbi:MAG: hypothetical protein AABY40_03450 [Nanoarchaeota archaeon]